MTNSCYIFSIITVFWLWAFSRFTDTQDMGSGCRQGPLMVSTHILYSEVFRLNEYVITYIVIYSHHIFISMKENLAFCFLCNIK